MAFPDGWAGYDTITLPNPASELTDFTYLLSLSSLSASWKSAASGTGGGIRVTDMSDNLIACDVILPYTSGTTGLLAFKFTHPGSGTQQVKIWADKSGESQPAASDTYGQYNAYASHVKAFYPAGGETDRTVANNTMTMGGSPTVGGTSGPINGSVGTVFDGTDDQATAGTSLVASAMHVLGCANKTNITSPAAFAGWRVGSANNWSLNFLGSGGSSLVELDMSGAGTVDVLTAASYAANVWQHIAGGFNADGTSVKVSLQGTTTEITTGTGIPSGTGTYRIGHVSNNSRFAGTIALVSFHNTQLSNDWVTYSSVMLNGNDPDQDSFYAFNGWTAAGAGYVNHSDVLARHLWGLAI